MSDWHETTDLLIVGTGPAGCTFARRVWDERPGARILMVDEGPVLSTPPGRHVLSLSPEERRRAQQLSGLTMADSSSGSATGSAEAVKARPGTYLLRDRGGRSAPMPAAALSSNVGGMGVFWTCACPAPYQSELVPFMPEDVLLAGLGIARSYLGVRNDGFADSTLQRAVIQRLGKLFDGRPPERQVQPIPLACSPTSLGRPAWRGPAFILGDREAHRSWLRPSTLCRRVITEGSRAVGVELVELPTQETYRVRADAVVIAGDAFRSPQLLFASGIVSPALGRYLSDQPQVVALATVSDVQRGSRVEASDDFRASLAGVVWVPYLEPYHPFHGQVLQLDAAPVSPFGPVDSQLPLVLLSWFIAPEVRADNRLRFSSIGHDAYGMPTISIEYELGASDLDRIEGATRLVGAVASALGGLHEIGHPRLLPAGTSLHYQGTVRMGDSEDGTSVCSPESRVWGLENVYVAGNGVIPTSVACNPTLLACALATIAAQDFLAGSHPN